MKTAMLCATIPLLMIGCTGDWQKNIDKQQVEQDQRLRATESRLNESTANTESLIREQNIKLAQLAQKLSDTQLELKKALSPVNVGGKWIMAGPHNVGKPCEIIQSENALVFVNESGNRSEGAFEGKYSVIASSWGGLRGDITENATRINWRNGTWWMRANQ